jgi:hypothetical protein
VSDRKPTHDWWSVPRGTRRARVYHGKDVRIKIVCSLCRGEGCEQCDGKGAIECKMETPKLMEAIQQRTVEEIEKENDTMLAELAKEMERSLWSDPDPVGPYEICECGHTNSTHDANGCKASAGWGNTSAKCPCKGFSKNRR